MPSVLAPTGRSRGCSDRPSRLRHPIGAMIGPPAAPDPIVRQSDRFAAYFIWRHVVREGFWAGTVPGAEALADACDVVLTYNSAALLRILCIVDRERDPASRFSLSADEVARI